VINIPVRKRDRVGWLARSSAAEERSATSLKTGSWRRVSWSFWSEVAGQDAVDPGADHLQEGVLHEVGVAGVVEGSGEGPGEPEALVELADGQQPGVAGQLVRRRLDDERRAEKVEDLWPGGGYTHRLPPRLRPGPDALTG
jgi:hypothetical protein